MINLPQDCDSTRKIQKIFQKRISGCLLSKINPYQAIRGRVIPMSQKTSNLYRFPFKMVSGIPHYIMPSKNHQLNVSRKCPAVNIHTSKKVKQATGFGDNIFFGYFYPRTVYGKVNETYSGSFPGPDARGAMRNEQNNALDFTFCCNDCLHGQSPGQRLSGIPTQGR